METTVDSYSKGLKENLMNINSKLLSAGISLVVVLFTPASSVIAHNTATGSASVANVKITKSRSWDTVRSATVVIPQGDSSNHTCVATGSADMQFKGNAGDNNRYRFVVSRNEVNPTINTPAERNLELVDNQGVDDPNSKPVSTNRTFFGVRNNNGLNGSGIHRFRFLAKKVPPNTKNADVLDSSFSVICVENS